MRIIIVLLLPFLFGFGLPRGTQLEEVSKGLEQNGLRMDIQYFKHRDAPEVFTKNLRELLRNQSGEVITKPLSDNTVSIGLLSEKYFVNVTVKSDARGGTEGFYTKTTLRRKKVPVPPLQIPYSMEMISHIKDPVGRGRKDTWVYRSKRDLLWVRNQLKQQNLQEVHRSVDGSTLYEGDAGRHQLQITVTATEDGTGMVIVK